MFLSLRTIFTENTQLFYGLYINGHTAFMHIMLKNIRLYSHTSVRKTDLIFKFSAKSIGFIVLFEGFQAGRRSSLQIYNTTPE